MTAQPPALTGKSPASATSSSGSLHRSPGITAIYNELKSSKRNSILDLGSASRDNFQFFSTLSCHIHFEGIDGFLADCGEAWASGEALRTALNDYLSTFDNAKQFDIILAWDIFNYLDRDTLHWLMSRLNQHCHANTLLHMIKYVGRNLPAMPRQYQILDQYRIKTASSRVLCSRPFANIDTTATLKSMPGYVMEQTFIQHDGMAQDITEHVLRYQPESRDCKRQIASAELSMAADVLPQHTQPHRSYALEQICTYLRKLPNPTVLNLGPKATHSGDFFLDYADKVYVEDIAQSLFNTPGEGEAPLRQHVLQYPPDVTFDVIIAWDLLTFCSRAQLAAIYQRLKPHFRPNTQIFALFYTGTTRPERPQKCYVIDDKNIELLPTPRRRIEGEDLSTVAMLKIFSDFQLTNTYILRPGMQRGIYEYVFKAAAALRPVVPSSKT